MSQKIGFIGLGRMGNAMVEHMLEKGIEVVAYNRTKEKVDEIAREGATPAYSLKEMFEKLRGEGNERAIIWLMIKSGDPVDQLLFALADGWKKMEEESLSDFLHEGDIVIDGGNSYYKDTKRRAGLLKEKGVHFMDCGTSGGIQGARHGACLMVGGEKDVYDEIEWLYRSLAQENGYGYMGANGSGHYVKMVHNAIEYGMMQSIAEGLDLLETGAQDSLGNPLQLAEVLRVWNHGSIVESYLTRITEHALTVDPHLNQIGDRVDDNGEGAWTILEAISAKIPFLTVAHALFMRYTTRRDESFAMKVVAAQRNEFGGHEVEKK